MEGGHGETAPKLCWRRYGSAARPFCWGQSLHQLEGLFPPQQIPSPNKKSKKKQLS